MTPPRERYLAPAGTCRFELREKGSRFLAIVESVDGEAVARRRLKSLASDYADATHVCWAWRVGRPAREGRSDAGEPSGTAGSPMLQVLRGSELSDVLAVVVRWYGGVKLGKGGLARAYAGAVRQALEDLATVERIPTVSLEVVIPYPRLGEVKRLVHPPEVEILEEQYSDETVRLTLKVVDSRMEWLEEVFASLGAEITPAGG